MASVAIKVKDNIILRSISANTAWIKFNNFSDDLWLHFDSAKDFLEFANDLKKHAEERYAEQFELLGDE